jgi:hypothetical protein
MARSGRDIATALTCILQGFCQLLLAAASPMYDQLYDHLPPLFDHQARAVWQLMRLMHEGSQPKEKPDFAKSRTCIDN